MFYYCATAPYEKVSRTQVIGLTKHQGAKEEDDDKLGSVIVVFTFTGLSVAEKAS